MRASNAAMRDSDEGLPFPAVARRAAAVSYGSVSEADLAREVDRIRAREADESDQEKTPPKRHWLLRWVPEVSPGFLVILMVILAFLHCEVGVRREILVDIQSDIATGTLIGLCFFLFMFTLSCLLGGGLAALAHCCCCCGICCWLPILFFGLWRRDYFDACRDLILEFFYVLDDGLYWPPQLLRLAFRWLILDRKLHDEHIYKQLPPTYSDCRIAAYGCFVYMMWLVIVFIKPPFKGEIFKGLFVCTPLFMLSGAFWTNRFLGELARYVILILQTSASRGLGALHPLDVMVLVLLLWWFLLPWPVPEILLLKQARDHHEKLFNDALNEPYHATLERAGTKKLFRAMSTAIFEEEQPPESATVNVATLNEKRKALLEHAKTVHRNSIPHGSKPISKLNMSVSRQNLLEDSLTEIREAVPQQLALSSDVFFDAGVYGAQTGFHVKFEGEDGIDAGGLRRDWFDSVGQALLKGADEAHGSSFFALAPDKTLVPRCTGADELKRAGTLDQNAEVIERLRKLMDVGRFVALAVLHEQPVPLCLGAPFLKCMLKVPVHFSDVRQLDPEFYRIRVQTILKEGGLEEMEMALGEPLTFVSAAADGADPVPLVENGEQLMVTEANKKEYIMLLCEAYLCGHIRTEMGMFLRGFWEVLPHASLKASAINFRELSLLISGLQDIDVASWKQHCQWPSVRVVHWFWEVLEELSNDQRNMVLQFSTGSSRLPPGGFEQLQPRFTVELVAESGEHFPHSHTCANQIMLPQYTSKEQLKEKLVQAISIEGGAGFGFA